MLVRGGTAAAVTQPAIMDHASGDLAYSLWPLWRRALQRMETQTEAERDLGLAEAALARLTDGLLVSRSTSITSVEIKLQALLELAPHACGGDDEFPWPQIRAVIESIDL